MWYLEFLNDSLNYVVQIGIGPALEETQVKKFLIFDGSLLSPSSSSASWNWTLFGVTLLLLTQHPPPPSSTRGKCPKCRRSRVCSSGIRMCSYVSPYLNVIKIFSRFECQKLLNVLPEPSWWTRQLKRLMMEITRMTLWNCLDVNMSHSPLLLWTHVRNLHHVSSWW